MTGLSCNVNNVSRCAALADHSANANQIAYLVPEFPGQTHAFFWRERAALKRLGVQTHLVSTRRPPPAIVSHSWSDQAQRETFYLSEMSFRDIFLTSIQLLWLGPRAWIRAAFAAVEDSSPRHWPLNFAMVFVAMRLITFMRAKNVAHVHSHSCANAALITMFANRLANVSYSLTLHGDLQTYGRQQNVKWRYAAFAITITRQLFQQVQQTLQENLPRDIGLAPMGVDTAVFKRTKPYKPWNGQGPLRLFSCGRLNRGKGFQDLIHAISILKTSGTEVNLEIAGEDDIGGSGFRRELHSLIDELKLTENVALLGAVAERRVVEGLEAAHFFVLASRDEALGVAIMEALSCETPLIATNVGGVPELVDHRIDGYLVSPHDPQALADAIRYVANSPMLAMQFSACSRVKIERHFNPDLSATELKRLLDKLMILPSSPPIG